jgi:uncharacterized oligopeptide transporter (OPT) family protein
MIFKPIFSSNDKDIFYIQMVTTSASIATFGIGIAFAALTIFHVSDLSLLGMVLLTIASNLVAMVLANAVENKWIRDDKLPFPKGKAFGELLRTITDDENKVKGRRIFLFAVGSIVWSTVVNIKNKIRFPFIALGMPNYLGIELSPMLFGVGLLLSLKSAMLMCIGSIYGVAVYLSSRSLYENLTFQEHLNNRFIMSAAIGLIIANVFQSLPKLWKKMRNSLTSGINVADRTVFQSHIIPILAVLTLFVVSFTLINVKVTALLVWLLIFLPLSIVTMRLRGETGVGSSAVVYVAIPILGLVSRDAVSTMLLSGMVVLVGTQAGHFLENLKVAYEIGCEKAKMQKYYGIGIILGSSFGLLTLFVLSKFGMLGSVELPAPTLTAWSAQVNTVVDNSNAANVNVWIILISIIIGWILEMKNISASSIAMGILLPVSSVVPMVLGCICKIVLEKRKYNYISSLTSGLILGDGFYGFVRALFQIR